ncbi:copper chaperone PCu(A)C [Thiomicrorhabdus sp. 6S3-12]|uniref:copper chaperone PCu(A)C n=1 Tax=Thiomicrorhabdus sp. 6S3-12 TaxID=2819681 RepID=UPI001AADE084|nr:copper chaperone PCu(A)C [Thiomicrorhabdus sp. 6S3-12]MBO1923356.1 copper chaperone PCu(A)C [Thiomicrorhabdus sp. 6S3-12]
MKPTSLLAIAAGCLIGWQTAFAATVAESVEISDPYVRMVPPTAPASAAFMTIKNTDGKDHSVVSAKGYINKITELHTHIHDNGVMRMRRVEKIDLPAGQTTALQPGGLHIMLINLNEPVKDGQKYQIDLTFEDGSTKTVEAQGRPIVPPRNGMGAGPKMGTGMGPGMKCGGMMMKGPGAMSGAQLSNGRNSNPMRMVMHANPAFPNLTGIAVKNAAELNLSAEQVSELKGWTAKHGDKMQKMFQQVDVLEKELIQDALAGQPKAELMAKFEKTLALRKQIAETKIDCRDNMKKVLSAEQFDKLASIYPMM